MAGNLNNYLELTLEMPIYEQLPVAAPEPKPEMTDSKITFDFDLTINTNTIDIN